LNISLQCTWLLSIKVTGTAITSLCRFHWFDFIREIYCVPMWRKNWINTSCKLILV